MSTDALPRGVEPEGLSADPTDCADACVRSLGAIETAMAISHDLAQGSTQSLLVVYMVGRVPFDLLREGAMDAFATYRLLRCAIDKRPGGDLAFVDHGDWSRVEVARRTLTNPEAWSRLEAAELHEPVDARRALWRLALYSDQAEMVHRLVVVFHHAIVDSDGAKAVLRILLKHASGFPPGGTRKHFDVPPSVDHFLSVPKTAQSVSAPMAAAATSRLPHAHQAPVPQRRTNLLHDRLDAQTMLAVNARCKADRITFDAAVAAALARACELALPMMPPIGLKTAVSLRALAMAKGATQDGLGCYIGVADAVIDDCAAGAPAVAHTYQNRLLAQTMGRLMKRLPFDTAALEQGIAGIRDSGDFTSVGLTNVGQLLDQRSFGNFDVVDVYNVTNRVLGGPALVLQMSCFADEWRFLYMFVEPLMPMAVVDAVRAQFNQQLLAYVMDNLGSGNE